MVLVALRNWFREPLFLLALAAGLIAFAVQSGELGNSDTQHRDNSAHALWTSAPAVLPQEYPDFGIIGRGGKLQSGYAIGQSLLMLPSDVIGSLVERLPAFDSYRGNDPTVRNIMVSYCTNIFLSVVTALICFCFLRQLQFEVKEAVAGVLALLLATTHLHYTQNLMENNYICLLTLMGFSYQYEWLRTGSRRALLIGSCALGLNLLTRLTTGMDLLAGGLFVLLALWLEGIRGRALWKRCRCYLAIALPVYLIFGLLDRAYQFYRFGSFFSNYASMSARIAIEHDPSLPANFPFSNAFSRGLFRGSLCAGEVDFSLRSVAGSDDCAGSGGVETVQRAGAGLCDYVFVAAACLHQLLRKVLCRGQEIPPGATDTLQPRWNWRLCWPFRC